MVSDDEIRAAVETALNKRRAMASSSELAVVAQLVKGQLRDAIGTLPLDAVALTFTDLLLDGRRNTPPNPYRPQLRQLVRSVFETRKVSPPAADVVEVLVSVAAGYITDRSLPLIPAGRAVVIRGVAQLYLLGA